MTAGQSLSALAKLLPLSDARISHHAVRGLATTRGRRLVPTLDASTPSAAERVMELSYLELQRFEDEQQRHRLRPYGRGISCGSSATARSTPS